ncbi:hypothetical protein GLOTRDRAFT_137524 [Gloeophyllum trabeum ATCC 11539]|uniref:Protein kinase domain-containing protein n=1 Tax=Gloeophyllum trabeum (strain ATCC 11539 / FP-39264 / Madison 617) TaxID=670483 RepID=S7QB08_GLOTA|nr:uncharacterized protein GLOTRDRAFT_137524 [Gloeophyllum trabeum ATCC 11539]EPQ57111.1 hypothetical protein GLOTRDRAFT_137524 [Gloeophyllum trabeum ATCC 11539]
MSSQPDAQGPPPHKPGELAFYELFWRDHQQWLQSRGYMLRSRYMPGWVPSWKGTKRHWSECEDGQSFPHRLIVDAIRVSDGALVALKRVPRANSPNEGAIGLLFSSDPLKSDPQNHCVPIYEVLEVPDDADSEVIVMPFLRLWYNPPFDTFGEVVSFLQQTIEGLHFMHKHLVAHRDCTLRNIMMDPSALYPESFHPVSTSQKRNLKGHAKHYTRTQRPVKYYLIDFGLSRRYKPEDMPPMEEVVIGGDRTVPEFQDVYTRAVSSKRCDPFPTDIYTLGNVMKSWLIEKNAGFEFLQPLVSDMVQEEPAKRPKMEEVLTRFEDIRKSLSTRKLRSRVVPRDENLVEGLFRAIGHWSRRVIYIIRRTPAVPMPP